MSVAAPKLTVTQKLIKECFPDIQEGPVEEYSEQKLEQLIAILKQVPRKDKNFKKDYKGDFNFVAEEDATEEIEAGHQLLYSSPEVRSKKGHEEDHSLVFGGVKELIPEESLKTFIVKYNKTKTMAASFDKNDNAKGEKKEEKDKDCDLAVWRTLMKNNKALTLSLLTCCARKHTLSQWVEKLEAETVVEDDKPAPKITPKKTTVTPKVTPKETTKAVAIKVTPKKSDVTPDETESDAESEPAPKDKVITLKKSAVTPKVTPKKTDSDPKPAPKAKPKVTKPSTPAVDDSDTMAVEDKKPKTSLKRKLNPSEELKAFYEDSWAKAGVLREAALIFEAEASAKRAAAAKKAAESRAKNPKKTKTNDGTAASTSDAEQSDTE